jgi:hypothetical protein
MNGRARIESLNNGCWSALNPKLHDSCSSIPASKNPLFVFPSNV